MHFSIIQGVFILVIPGPAIHEITTAKKTRDPPVYQLKMRRNGPVNCIVQDKCLTIIPHGKKHEFYAGFYGISQGVYDHHLEIGV
jgi:hypothetical protein